MSPSTPKKTYTGSCHCGRVTYTLSHAPLSASEVTNCNCSICVRNGYLIIYPEPEDFKLLSGAEVLKSYEFGKKKIVHRFCGECGTSVFAEGESWGYLGVNVRTFADVDVGALKLKANDGKNEN